MRRSANRSAAGLGALLALVTAVTLLPGGAAAEQASQPSSPLAGRLDLGRYHSCAVLSGGSVRCWGYGGDGALGYGNRATIGDDETPAAAGPVDLGAGRTATALSAGSVFTCALLDDATVRCWGFGGDGRLGYGNIDSIGDTETPGSVGPVDLGAGRTARAIAAGRAHTCAVLDDGNVRCWGFGYDGRLGYGNNIPDDNNNVGDNEAPGSVGPVALGSGRTATAITAGDAHTCALLDDGSVRCWGNAADGELGYGNVVDIGDDETPGSVGPVDLGAGRTAVAIAGGYFHTCAVLDDGTVRCWGYGGNGRLGYANSDNIGDDETPGTVGVVDLGAGRTATAITAGGSHTCALLDDGRVRCWGSGDDGQLGYGNRQTIGDDETPAAAGPVDLGAGRTAVAISAGGDHTCALLDDGVSVRCWGRGINGELGSCSRDAIGDDETPASARPVDLGTPGVAGGCPSGIVAPPPPVAPTPPAAVPGPATPATSDADGLGAEAARRVRLRDCRVAVRRQARGERSRVHRSHPGRRMASTRAPLLAKVEVRAAVRRARCVKRFGRTPDRVATLTARASAKGTVVLTFEAPASDGSGPPAARGYLVKQSLGPIRTKRDFERARALCKGTCTFPVTKLGADITLTVNELRRRTTYHYAVAARDNVSHEPGPRSATVKATTG